MNPLEANGEVFCMYRRLSMKLLNTLPVGEGKEVSKIDMQAGVDRFLHC